MRLTWALLAFLEQATAADTYAAVALKASCSDQVGCAGYYRAFGVKTSPLGSDFGPPSTVTGISVGAIGASASNTSGTVKGNLDVAGFRFKTPADMSDGANNKGLSFYFGYLGVSGAWDQSTKTGAVAGALAEVVSNLASINVWYDNDNVVGFNWDIAQSDAAKRYNILNCADGEAKGYDTMDAAGTLDLKDMTWTAIAHTKVDCNTEPALSGAPAGCEIHSLTTVGSHAASGSAVITFTARIASQPVLINNVRHGPDFAKFDVTVEYPWSAVTGLYNADKAKIALVAFNAGKSGSVVGAAKKNADGSDSLVFAAQGAASTSHYSYTAIADVDGTSGPVTTQVISGQQILAFSCIGAPCGFTATASLAAGLQLAVVYLQGLGWKSSITIHALGAKSHPLKVFWDPEVGAGPGSDAHESSAALAIPGVLLLVAGFLFC